MWDRLSGPSARSAITEPDALKFIFSFDMFLGRVEIYPVLAVFASIFHKG